MGANSSSKGGFREDSSPRSKESHGGGHGEGSSQDYTRQSSSSLASSSHHQPTPKSWWKLRYRHNQGSKSKSTQNNNDSLLLFKEYLNSLSNPNLVKLLHAYNKLEYEYIEWRKCESSRFVGNTVEQDLENLLDYKYNCDITLNINSVASFPAHISILKQRSNYFRAFLFNCEERCAQVGYSCGAKELDYHHHREKEAAAARDFGPYGYHRSKEGSQEQHEVYQLSKDLKLPYERKLLSVDLNLGSTNIHSFSKSLRYLYTGIDEEHGKDQGSASGSCRSEESGIALGINPGKNSLKIDLNEMLINGSYTDLILIWRCSKQNSEYVFPCHKSILSARSPFFRNLLSRSMHQHELEIDENIIQKKFAILLLTCLYTDVLDLKLVGKYSLQPSMGEDRKDEIDLPADGSHKAYFDIIIQIYQIGRFLEFDLLCNQCEDLIINNILNNSDPANSVDGNTVFQVLKWSTEAFGSKYVQRQCIQYILFNYNELVKNNNILQALSDEMMEILVSSSFIQAAECEILGSLMQWCNLQLSPSAVMPIVGESACQRGIQRIERNSKLNQLLRPFIKWIRFEQILNRSVINQCLINNLFGNSGGENAECELILNFLTRPRYVQSFHNEIIAIFYSKQTSFVPTSSTTSATNCIPDTLYMLDGTNTNTNPSATPSSSGATSGNQPITLDNNIVIEPELLAAMKQREKKLCSQNKQMELTPCLLQYIRLRIVREFGFPDSTVQILNGLTRFEENWNDTSPSTSLSNRMPDVAIVDNSSNPTSTAHLPTLNINSSPSSTQQQIQKETLEQGLIDLDLGDGAIGNHGMNAATISSNSSSLGRLNHFRVDVCYSTTGRERGERERSSEDFGRKDHKSRIPRFL